MRGDIMASEVELIRTQDVCNLLKVGRATICLWVKEKGLPHYKIGRSIRFDRVEVLRWVQQYRQKKVTNPERGTLQAVLQHAGKWSDMSDDEAEDLIQDIRGSHRSSQRESEF
jgi:excisionase family DNA binding protein